MRSMFVTIVTVMVLYAGTSWLVHSLARRSVLRHADERIEKWLAEFVSDIDWEETGFDLDFHLKSPPEFAEGSRTAFYELRDYQQKVMLRSYSLGMDGTLPLVADGIFMNGQLPNGTHIRAKTKAFFAPIDEDSDPAKVIAPPLDAPENRYYFTIAESTSEMDGHLESVAHALWFGGAFLAIACAVVSALLARWLNQPILRLAEQVAAIDIRSLEKRLPAAEAPSEILPIVSQFNALLDRLHGAVQRERRFASAIAHELRTPVSEIRMLADVALLECNADGSHENPRGVFQDFDEISQRMTSLIEVLTAVHRIQEGTANVETHAMDLCSIATRAESTFRQRAADAGHKFIMRLTPQAVMVHADAHLMGAIAINLTRNALQHATKGTHVEIEVTANPPAFIVSNPTDSLKADDLPMLSEPFWQKDSARTHRDRFGIGLTLCRAYAGLMNVRLTFTLTNGIFSAKVELQTT